MSPLALTTSPAVDSDCSSSDQTNGPNSQNQSPSEKAAQQQRKKKARTTFTGRQIFELEKQFELKKYLSSSERAEMAKLLNVTETQVSFGEIPGVRQGKFGPSMSGHRDRWLPSENAEEHSRTLETVLRVARGVSGDHLAGSAAPRGVK